MRDGEAAARRTAARRRLGAALALVLVLVTAVGAVLSGGRDTQGGGASAGPGAPAGLRWLTPDRGPARTVAAENRAAGTKAWELPARASRAPKIAAYVSDQTIRPGQQLRVYVDAPGAAWVRVDIYRMGWYGGRGGRLVLASPRLAARHQPPCAHSDATGLTECRWHPTLAARVPPTLTSGVYVVKLTDSRGEQRDCLFVLEAARPAPMLAQIPIATYEAYNNWGGDGLYPGYQRVGATGTEQGVEVSFDRPYDSATGAGQFFKGDVAMVRFLEQRGYPLSYTTGASVDRDPSKVLGGRVLVDVGHSEYWSQADESAFVRARDGGVNLAFMSSDTLAWRVRYLAATAASSEAGAAAHRMVAYKEFAARDPDQTTPSGAFPDLGAALTGTAYQKCITPSSAGGLYHYYSWHPSPALAPPWLFKGTGLTAASEVPGIVGYELDARTPATPAGSLRVGGGVASCRGPAATNAADTTLYRAPSGALVFSTGMLGWQYGLTPLPAVSPDVPRRPDQRLARLTDNLFVRMLSGAKAP